MESYNNIDEYIAQYPAEVQVLLTQMRNTIREALPQATEAIKYGLPTFVLHGNVVHFGGFKAHIGFYPSPNGIDHFESELSGYERSKGAVRFPLTEPLPLDLVRRIAIYRASKNAESATGKKAKRT